MDFDRHFVIYTNNIFRFFSILACAALIAITETEAAAIVSLDEVAADSAMQLNSSERKCQDLLFNSDVAKELRLEMYEKCLEANYDTNSAKSGFALNDGSGEEIDSYRRGGSSSGGGGGLWIGGSGRRNSASTTNSISVVTCILLCLVAKFLND